MPPSQSRSDMPTLLAAFQSSGRGASRALGMVHSAQNRVPERPVDVRLGRLLDQRQDSRARAAVRQTSGGTSSDGTSSGGGASSDGTSSGGGASSDGAGNMSMQAQNLDMYDKYTQCREQSISSRRTKIIKSYAEMQQDASLVLQKLFQGSPKIEIFNEIQSKSKV